MLPGLVAYPGSPGSKRRASRVERGDAMKRFTPLKSSAYGQQGKFAYQQGFFCEGVNRRDVTCGGGAAVFSAMLAALLGGSKLVTAEGITGPVPEVDRVAVQVVID